MPKNNTIPEWMQKEVEAYDLCIVPPPQSVLDIGANIGAYVLRCAAKWPDAWIIAYEPVSETCEQLADNCYDLARVAIVRQAVGRENEGRHIFIGQLPVTSSFYKRGRQTDRTEPVLCVNAKHIPSSELVKIDTEGCEVEILERLDLSKTRAVAVEYHSAEDRDKILTILEAQSFQLLHEWVGEPGYGVFRFAKDSGVTLPAAKPVAHRKVYLAIAGHFANNDVIFVQSLLAMAIQPQVSTAFGWSCDPSVERARNILTANFLESDCTHILFVDADIGFSSADVERICGHQEPVVGGLYPLKTITESVQWCANGLQPGDAQVREDGLTEVKYAGTGFLCIAREVFEALKQHIAVLPYTQDFPPHRKEVCYWFQRVCNGRFLTEDWNFSQLCQDLRFKIFLDSKVVLRHSGRAEWPLPIQKGNPFLPQKETKETKP